MIMVIFLGLAAAGLGGAGVYLLAGLAWTLIFAAACCAVFAAVIVRGLS